MNNADIDIGHDKGLAVLYAHNEITEITDKGHDKGQSVPYNTRAVVNDESGQSVPIGNTGNLDAIANKGITKKLEMIEH